MIALSLVLTTTGRLAGSRCVLVVSKKASFKELESAFTVSSMKYEEPFVLKAMDSNLTSANKPMAMVDTMTFIFFNSGNISEMYGFRFSSPSDMRIMCAPVGSPVLFKTCRNHNDRLRIKFWKLSPQARIHKYSHNSDHALFSNIQS